MLFHCLITHIVCCFFFPPETESAKSHPAAFLISWRFTLQRGIAFCCQMSFSLLKGRSNYNNPVCLPAPVLGTQTPAAALAVGAQAGGSRQGHRARGCTELVWAQAHPQGRALDGRALTWHGEGEWASSAPGVSLFRVVSRRAHTQRWKELWAAHGSVWWRWFHWACWGGSRDCSTSLPSFGILIHLRQGKAAEIGGQKSPGHTQKNCRFWGGLRYQINLIASSVRQC